MALEAVDVFNGTIALIALSLSGLNAYHQFLRRKQDFRMSFLGISFSPHHLCENTVIVEVAFVNNGNTPATVSDMALVLDEPDEGGHVLLQWERFADDSVAHAIHLAPGEVAHRSVIFFCTEKNAEELGLPPEGEAGFPTAIRVWVVNYKGERYEADIGNIKLYFVGGQVDGAGATVNQQIRVLPQSRKRQSTLSPNALSSEGSSSWGGSEEQPATSE